MIARGTTEYFFLLFRPVFHSVLAPERIGFRRVPFDVRKCYRTLGACVLGSRATIMRIDTLLDIVGDPSVERAIGAAYEIESVRRRRAMGTH